MINLIAKKLYVVLIDEFTINCKTLKLMIGKERIKGHLLIGPTEFKMIFIINHS